MVGENGRGRNGGGTPGWFDPVTGDPTPLAIAAWVENPNDCPHADRIASYVANHRRGRQEAALARSFLRPGANPLVDEGDLARVRAAYRNRAVRFAARRPRRLPWIAGGLATAAAATLLIVFAIPRGSGPPEIAPFIESGTFRGGTVDIVTPARPRLLEHPAQVAWHEVIGATGYRVTLTRADGRPLLTGPASEPTLEIPEGIWSASETPVERFTVTVEALDEQGEVFAHGALDCSVLSDLDPQPTRERSR